MKVQELFGRVYDKTCSGMEPWSGVCFGVFFRTILSRFRTPLRSEDDHAVTLSSELEETDINMQKHFQKSAPLHGTTSLHVFAYVICAFVADTCR